MNENHERKLEVTAKDVFDVLIKRWIVIVLCGLVVASAFLLGTKLLITPQYQSSTTIFVLSKQNEDKISSTDFQISTHLTKDYARIIKSRDVAEQVKDQLGLEISAGAIQGKISVETEDDTRIVTIVVNDPDPVMAQRMAEAIRVISAKKIVDVMKVETVTVVDTASFPTSPSTPNTRNNVILGGALGCLLAIAVVLLQHYSNDTIKDTDDVEHYLGLNVLASIPTNEPNTKKKKRGGRK
ncbi:MAG: protein-tyrosine kinase [Oscillospiraceae bacterium]|nr:protein-tyrosine kinase [Oscillospiraceae bacterium]